MSHVAYYPSYTARIERVDSDRAALAAANEELRNGIRVLKGALFFVALPLLSIGWALAAALAFS